MACRRCQPLCTAPRLECPDRAPTLPSRSGPGRPDPALVSGLPLFEGLEPAIIAELLSEACLLERTRQALLFSAGAPADGFFILLAGKVKLFAITEDGKEGIVEIFTPLSSFAEAAMFACGRFPLNAEVVEEARLIRVGASGFLSALRRRPAVALRMLASLNRWSHRLSSEIWLLKERTPEQRVASFLLSLTDAGEGAVEVDLPFRKGLVASRVGIGRESFSRVLARLRRHGVETEGNRVRIRDVGFLRRLCAPFPEP